MGRVKFRCPECGARQFQYASNDKDKRHLMALSAPAVEDRLKPATCTSFFLPTDAKAGMEEIRQAVCFFRQSSAWHQSNTRLRW